MYTLDEEQLYTLEQIAHKITVVRQLAENGGDRSLSFTSAQLATLLIDFEDALLNVINKVERSIQTESSTEPSE